MTTPRTDAMCYDDGESITVPAYFARKLERELAAAKSRLREIEQQWAAYSLELAAAREENALLREAADQQDAACIDRLLTERNELRTQLAAAHEELERVRDKCNEHYMALAVAQEANQRFADRNLKDMDRMFQLEERVQRAEADAKLGRILMRYIDRLDDPVPDDALPDIVAVMVKEAIAAIDAAAREIISKRGDVVFDAGEQAVIYKRRRAAEDAIDPEYFAGERVVPVEIVYKEGK